MWNSSGSVQSNGKPYLVLSSLAVVALRCRSHGRISQKATATIHSNPWPNAVQSLKSTNVPASLSPLFGKVPKNAVRRQSPNRPDGARFDLRFHANPTAFRCNEPCNIMILTHMVIVTVIWWHSINTNGVSKNSNDEPMMYQTFIWSVEKRIFWHKGLDH